MRIALLVAALAAPAAAQCYEVPDDTPDAGECNSVPFGRDRGDPLWSNQRYQSLITKVELGGVDQLITGLQFAPCSATSASGTYQIDRLVIVMDHRRGALGTLFADNLSPAAMTVLDVSSHEWPVTGGAWHEIGLQRSFKYENAKGDLVLDVTAYGTGLLPGASLQWGMRRHDGRQRVYDFGWTTSPPDDARFVDNYAAKVRVCASFPDVAMFGRGCPAGPGTPATPALALSAIGSSGLGGSLSLSIGNVPPGSAAAFVVGFSNSPPAPVELSGFGAPGCRWYIHPFLAIPVPSLALQFTIPSVSRLEGAVFYTQALAVGVMPAVQVSDYARAVIGT
ncbi:MAG: hypothetical protein AAF628_16665 [Planctomycetota bacterium]